MRLFVTLGRDCGLTWLSADSAAPPGGPPAARDGATSKEEGCRAPCPADYLALCDAAARCSALLACDVAAKVTALARASRRAGVDAAPLEAATQIDIGELCMARPRVAADAAELAALYFSEWLPAGLLPAGSAPSREQREITFAFERRQNIVCRAVAGAGKTTTLLMCARRCPARQIVILTYNKRLQLEVARRAAATRVQVFTYHAAAGKAYGGVVQNDEAFRRVVAAAPEAPLRFEVLMVDEAQDMAIEYFTFVRHLLRANPGAQVVVVGDELQAINEYRGARPEFLTEAPALYAGLAADRPWAACRLSVSHRLTPATAAFVNNHLYGAPVIVGGNSRDPSLRPLYVAGRTKADVALALAAAVKQAAAKYGPEGVFVLAPSVRNLANSRSPLADLVRRHLAGVPTFVAGQDDARVDADLIRGKLAVLSFNAAKGCERPCVVAVGLDETYFDYFDREWAEPETLPNVLTVAATRASAQLVVVANSSRTLRTVDYARLSTDANVRAGPRAAPARPRVRGRPPQRERPLSVTKLVRHLHPETVRMAMERVLVLPATGLLAAALGGLSPARAAPSKVRFGDFYEDLGFVYGIVAPVLAEVARTGGSAFGEGLDAPTIVADGEAVRPFSTDITGDEYAAYPDLFWEAVTEAALTPCEDRSPAEWGRLAVARHAMEGGHHHVARQVTDYSWVSGEALDAARDTILHVLDGVAGSFEVRLPSATVGPHIIVGRADFVEAGTGTVWEFKNAGDFCEEHALQLASYLALAGGGEGVLLSVLRREAWHVSVAAGDAGPLLWTLANKTREAAVDIFSLVERFDQGLASGDPPGGEPLADGAGDWELDDVF